MYYCNDRQAIFSEQTIAFFRYLRESDRYMTRVTGVKVYARKAASRCAYDGPLRGGLSRTWAR